MQTFTDRDKTLWEIDLTIGAVTDIKKASDGKFDLLNPRQLIDGADVPDDIHPHLQSVLTFDLATLWELLWYIVEDQAEKEGISAKDFGKRMSPEALIDAQEAFFREWRDFFLNLRRHEQAMALEKLMLYQSKLVAGVKARLPQLSKMDARMEKEIERLLNESFGSLQELLDSALNTSGPIASAS